MPENITEEQALALGQLAHARAQHRQAEGRLTMAEDAVKRANDALVSAFGDWPAALEALDALDSLPAAA